LLSDDAKIYEGNAIAFSLAKALIESAPTCGGTDAQVEATKEYDGEFLDCALMQFQYVNGQIYPTSR